MLQWNTLYKRNSCSKEKIHLLTTENQKTTHQLLPTELFGLPVHVHSRTNHSKKEMDSKSD